MVDAFPVTVRVVWVYVGMMTGGASTVQALVQVGTGQAECFPIFVQQLRFVVVLAGYVLPTAADARLERRRGIPTVTRKNMSAMNIAKECGSSDCDES
jgi:hypothetical protein